MKPDPKRPWRRSRTSGSPTSTTSTTPTATRASDEYFDEIEERRYRDALPPARALRLAAREPWPAARGRLRHRRRQHPAGRSAGSTSPPCDLTENAARGRPASSRRSAGVTIDFRLGNAEGLDFPDETLRRRVLVRRAPPHARHRAAAVGEVHRVLRPGGTAYVMLYHQVLAREPGAPGAAAAVRVAPRPQGPLPGRLHVQPARRPPAVRRLLAESTVRAAYPFTYGFGPLGTASRVDSPPARPSHRLALDDHRSEVAHTRGSSAPTPRRRPGPPTASDAPTGCRRCRRPSARRSRPRRSPRPARRRGGRRSTHREPHPWPGRR